MTMPVAHIALPAQAGSAGYLPQRLARHLTAGFMFSHGPYVWFERVSGIELTSLKTVPHWHIANVTRSIVSVWQPATPGSVVCAKVIVNQTPHRLLQEQSGLRRLEMFYIMAILGFGAGLAIHALKVRSMQARIDRLESEREEMLEEFQKVVDQEAARLMEVALDQFKAGIEYAGSTYHDITGLPSRARDNYLREIGRGYGQASIVVPYDNKSWQVYADKQGVHIEEI